MLRKRSVLCDRVRGRWEHPLEHVQDVSVVDPDTGALGNWASRNGCRPRPSENFAHFRSAVVQARTVRALTLCQDQGRPLDRAALTERYACADLLGDELAVLP